LVPRWDRQGSLEALPSIFFELEIVDLVAWFSMEASIEIVDEHLPARTISAAGTNCARAQVWTLQIVAISPSSK
jgi:hypothetical protein